MSSKPIKPMYRKPSCSINIKTLLSTKSLITTCSRIPTSPIGLLSMSLRVAVQSGGQVLGPLLRLIKGWSRSFKMRLDQESHAGVNRINYIRKVTITKRRIRGRDQFGRAPVFGLVPALPGFARCNNQTLRATDSVFGLSDKFPGC